VLTIGTFEGSHLGHFEFTPFYSQGFTLNQSIGNLPAGRFDDPPEGLPGNIHLFRRLFLIEALKVRQTERFEFIYS
jgi:FAD synthase